MVAHLAHHLLTSLPAPLLPFIRDEFHLDYATSGLVVSVFGIAYGIGQIPAGMVSDRIGARKMITVGICGVAVVGVLVGLSQTFVWMLILIALMGIVGGGYHPAAAPLISDAVPPEKRGRALGIHLIGGSGSNFLAPLIAVGIASFWGWRGAFLGLAVPTMILGIVFYKVLGRVIAPKTVQERVNEVEQAVPAAPEAPMDWRRLIAFMALAVLVQGVIVPVNSFIPLFMVDHFHVSEQLGAVFLSLIFFAGLWSSTLGGYLSDRLGTVPVMLTATLLSAPALFFLPRVGYGPLGIGIGALLVFAGMLMFIRMPVAESFIMSRTRPSNRSSILGVYYFLNMEIGAVLSPFVGILIDRFGFTSSFSGGAALVLVITVVASFFLIGTRR